MDYGYSHPQATWDDSAVWGAVQRAIEARGWLDKRAFDLGCGNGFQANKLSQLGFGVTAVDPSDSGIATAKEHFPQLKTAIASAYDDLAAKFGTFPLVYSIEVVEHLIDPKLYARRFFDLLEPRGLGIISTPYHGWLKNVAISVAGKWDSHHDVLWDGGHLKFFSRAKLTELLSSVGFKNISIERVGRIPPLAKSMVATFTR
jgi:2-polyprenyl-6-hydroxyphenyl methylase/3-demethylubiquinone-9 3-methyltransferase